MHSGQIQKITGQTTGQFVAQPRDMDTSGLYSKPDDNTQEQFEQSQL